MVNSEGKLKLTFDLQREAVKNAQREGGGLKFVAFGILHTAKAFYYTVKKNTVLLT